MLKSLTFTGGEGYITETAYKTVLRKQYKGWTDEDVEADIKRRKENGEWLRHYVREDYYIERKAGKKNPHLIKNLLNRTFEFSADKINILFGPNASGKTTIIKTIARYCLCGDNHASDGFTNIAKVEPLDYGFSWSEKTEYTQEKLKQILDKKNPAIIEWDGSPVYFENLGGRRQTGSIGDLAGSLMSQKEEFVYLVHRSKMSQGQNSMFLINQLMKICDNVPTRDDYNKILEKYKRNETWHGAVKNSLDYINSFGDGNGKLTLLLDETDKSMDISNVLLFYKEFLPMLQKKYNVQIIIVSHSPLMLSNIIQDNDNYNFISIDNTYTKEMKKLFEGVKF